MKKRLAGVLLVAALAVSQTVCVYGAGSITTRPQITAPDETGAETKTETGSTVKRVDPIQPEEEAAVVVDDTRVSFMTGTAATAGLPDATVETIKAINSAKVQISDVVKDVDVTGYAALTAVQSIVTKDEQTQTVKTGDVAVDLYVPNVVEGSGTIQILFYNNATGKWELITPSKIDYATKQITVNISGSGSFSVVYKK